MRDQEPETPSDSALRRRPNGDAGNSSGGEEQAKMPDGVLDAILALITGDKKQFNEALAGLTGARTASAGVAGREPSEALVEVLEERERILTGRKELDDSSKSRIRMDVAESSIPPEKMQSEAARIGEENRRLAQYRTNLEARRGINEDEVNAGVRQMLELGDSERKLAAANGASEGQAQQAGKRAMDAALRGFAQPGVIANRAGENNERAELIEKIIHEKQSQDLIEGRVSEEAPAVQRQALASKGTDQLRVELQSQITANQREQAQPEQTAANWQGAMAALGPQIASIRSALAMGVGTASPASYDALAVQSGRGDGKPGQDRGSPAV